MTFLLKEALVGNCRTSLIATISPLVRNAQESISTIRFAQRCSTLVLQNTVTANVAIDWKSRCETMGGKAKRLEEENAKLQNRLSLLEEGMRRRAGWRGEEGGSEEGRGWREDGLEEGTDHPAPFRRGGDHDGLEERTRRRGGDHDGLEERMRPRGDDGLRREVGREGATTAGDGRGDRGAERDHRGVERDRGVDRPARSSTSKRMVAELMGAELIAAGAELIVEEVAVGVGPPVAPEQIMRNKDRTEDHAKQHYERQDGGSSSTTAASVPLPSGNSLANFSAPTGTTVTSKYFFYGGRGTDRGVATSPVPGMLVATSPKTNVVEQRAGNKHHMGKEEQKLGTNNLRIEVPVLSPFGTAVSSSAAQLQRSSPAAFRTSPRLLSSPATQQQMPPVPHSSVPQPHALPVPHSSVPQPHALPVPQPHAVPTSISTTVSRGSTAGPAAFIYNPAGPAAGPAVVAAPRTSARCSPKNPPPGGPPPPLMNVSELVFGTPHVAQQGAGAQKRTIFPTMPDRATTLYPGGATSTTTDTISRSTPVVNTSGARLVNAISRLQMERTPTIKSSSAPERTAHNDGRNSTAPHEEDHQQHATARQASASSSSATANISSSVTATREDVPVPLFPPRTTVTLRHLTVTDPSLTNGIPPTVLDKEYSSISELVSGVISFYEDEKRSIISGFGDGAESGFGSWGGPDSSRGGSRRGSRRGSHAGTPCSSQNYNSAGRARRVVQQQCVPTSSAERTRQFPEQSPYERKLNDCEVMLQHLAGQNRGKGGGETVVGGAGALEGETTTSSSSGRFHRVLQSRAAGDPPGVDRGASRPGAAVYEEEIGEKWTNEDPCRSPQLFLGAHMDRIIETAHFADEVTENFADEDVTELEQDLSIARLPDEEEYVGKDGPSRAPVGTIPDGDSPSGDEGSSFVSADPGKFFVDRGSSPVAAVGLGGLGWGELSERSRPKRYVRVSPKKIMGDRSVEEEDLFRRKKPKIFSTERSSRVPAAAGEVVPVIDLFAASDDLQNEKVSENRHPVVKRKLSQQQIDVLEQFTSAIDICQRALGPEEGGRRRGR